VAWQEGNLVGLWIDDEDSILGEPIEHSVRTELKRKVSWILKPKVENLFYLPFFRVEDKDSPRIRDSVKNTSVSSP